MKLVPLAAVLALGVFALILPAARMRLRTGEWGIASWRSKDRIQRLMGLLLAVASAALLVWSILYLFEDPAELGIFSLPPLFDALGWVALSWGFLLIVAAQTNMGRSWRIGIDREPTPLVTGGLYGVVRNPIYTGLFLAMLGFVLLTPSPWTLAAYAVLVGVLAFQTRLEERHLFALHGERYRAYAAGVGRFFPGVGRLSS